MHSATPIPYLTPPLLHPDELSFPQSIFRVYSKLLSSEPPCKSLVPNRLLIRSVLTRGGRRENLLYDEANPARLLLVAGRT